MAIKMKCETCATTHGGFHLCLGRRVNVQAEQYEAIHRNTVEDVSNAKARGAKARWAIHWDANRERDEKIHRMYMVDRRSLQEVGDTFGLSKPTIKSIVLRLGGTMRPRNQGFNMIHNINKEN